MLTDCLKIGVSWHHIRLRCPIKRVTQAFYVSLLIVITKLRHNIFKTAGDLPGVDRQLHRLSLSCSITLVCQVEHCVLTDVQYDTLQVLTCVQGPLLG